MSERDKSSSPVAALLRYHLPPLAFGAMIIAVSSIPDLPGPEPTIIGIDKVAHFVEYAVFAFLIFRSVRRLMVNSRTLSRGLVTLALVFLFALFDEYYQSYIPGRVQDFYDVIADWLGGTVVVGWQWLKRRKRGRPRRSG